MRHAATRRVDSLERLEVERVDVGFGRVAAGRPEVFVAESRCLADARRPDGLGASRRRRARVGRTDVDVARLVDGEPRVVPGALVERLATQRRRDDPGHRHQRPPGHDRLVTIDRPTVCQVDMVALVLIVERRRL